MQNIRVFTARGWVNSTTLAFEYPESEELNIYPTRKHLEAAEPGALAQMVVINSAGIFAGDPAIDEDYDEILSK